MVPVLRPAQQTAAGKKYQLMQEQQQTHIITDTNSGIDDDDDDGAPNCHLAISSFSSAGGAHLTFAALI